MTFKNCIQILLSSICFLVQPLCSAADERANETISVAPSSVRALQLDSGDYAVPVTEGIAKLSIKQGNHSLTIIGLPEGKIVAEHIIDSEVSPIGITGNGSEVILIGSSGRISAIKWNADFQFETKGYPNLPIELTSPEMAVLNGKYYVFGLGTQDGETEKRSQFYSIDPALDTSWTRLSDFPGTPRMNTALHADGDRLIVFGGEAINGSSEMLNDIWSYRMKPTDGMTRQGWIETGTLPFSLSNSLAFSSGQSHVILFGGLSSRYDDQKLLNRVPNDSILIYNKVTETVVTGGTTDRKMPCGIVVDDKLALITDGPETGKVFEITVNPITKKLSMPDYVVMLLYFAAMAGIGFYFARKQNSSEEFALGNRNVKWWAAGISMFATGASSISFMAIPALAFRSSLIWMFPNFLLVLIFVVNAYLIFPLLRNLKMTSTYEYLESRYNPILRLIASFQCIAFQVLGRMSVVLLLPALAISAVTGLDVGTSVLLMGCLTAVYTALGGFEAVIWTDVCQGILMVLGAILMIVLAITGLPGGFGEFVSVNLEFQRFNMAIISWDYTLPVVWILVFNIIAQNLGYISDQPFIQRVFATPEKEMKRLAGMSAFCGIVIAVLVNLVGISIFAYFHAYPEQLNPVMKNDEVIPLYIVQRVPIGLAGLIIAALFAASMSTLSSSMNSVATLITEDFYRRIFKNSTDRARLILMKSGSLIVGLIGTGIAFYMAKLNIDSMFMIWNEIMALLGGGFVGVYMLGMFTKRTNSGGAIIGIACSIISVLLFKYGTDAHVFLYTPVALGSCVIGGYFGSLLFPQPTPESLRDLTVYAKR